MLAADTSSLVAYFSGEPGDDVDLLRRSLSDSAIALPPMVLTELLSDLATHKRLRDLVSDWRMLEITPAYWERCGHLRATLIARGVRAKAPDALIAQSCIDHDVALITRDDDFRHFVTYCGLKLA